MTFARIVAIGLAGLSFLGLPGAAQSEDIVLQAHRALYTVTLAGVRAEGDIVGATGGMEISLGRACDGWHMSQRFVLDLEASSGGTVRQDLSFAAWESRDANHYRFSARERFGEDSTSYHGSAEKNPGGAGTAVFTAPDDHSIPLPQGVLFPISHTRAIIATARAGKRLIAAPVFDGAVGKGAQDTVTVIGSKADGSGIPETLHGPLLAHPGWQVRTAYFDPDSDASTPEFEVGMTQLDNGVATGIRLDYASFSLLLRLTKLEPLPEPDC